MVKVALMVMSDTETHADRARVAELSDPDHRLHRAFEMVKDEISGACKACATAFGVREEVQASGIPLLTEYKGHQSLRERVIQGYQVITF